MCDKLVETPLSVASEQGTVFLEGRAVAVSMKPEAAIETADRLVEEAAAAMGQRAMVKAAGDHRTTGSYTGPDPDIDQAEGGVHDLPSRDPNAHPCNLEGGVGMAAKAEMDLTNDPDDVKV